MIKLVEDKVAVRPIFDSDKSPGGLWIPDIAKERSDQGVVKYVGPQVKDVRPGDYVLFSGYTGTLVILEGEGRFIVMPEEFIICKVDVSRKIRVPGLFFELDSGEYMTATYEQAIELLAQAVTEAGQALDVKSERLKSEDYDKARGL